MLMLVQCWRGDLRTCFWLFVAVVPFQSLTMVVVGMPTFKRRSF